MRESAASHLTLGGHHHPGFRTPEARRTLTNTPPDNTPFRAEAGESPSGADVPIWVTACVRLTPPAGAAADKAVTAAQVLLADRIPVYGQARVVSNHEWLAAFLGYTRRDKVKSVLDYLQQIGFLSVPELREADVDKHGRRKPQRDEHQRTVGDTFLVHWRPPAGYVGPQTLHELRDALRERRTWAFNELFLDPTSEIASNAGQPCTPQQVQGSESLYPATGTGNVSAGQPCTPQQGALRLPYIGDPSGISGGEIPEGRSAAPPASAGADAAAEDKPDWARLLVRALPWRSKSRRGPTTAEAGQLAEGFRLAASHYGLTEAEIREHALHKLDRSDAGKNPISYVIGAFRAEHLDRLRPAGDYEPLSEQPLPLPQQPEGQADAQWAEAKTAPTQPAEPASSLVAADAQPDQKSAPAADPSAHAAEIREQVRRRNLERVRQQHSA